MSNTLYRDTGYSLNYLIEEIRLGRIALPEIQRSFVWSDKQVRDLIDSLYRGYPVGTLLFWETDIPIPIRQIEEKVPNRIPKLLIIDGQQRLTSLYAVMARQPVLTHSFDKRQIKIAFRPRDERFEVTNDVINNDPEYIPDIARVWQNGYRTTVRQFFARLTDNRRIKLSPTTEEKLEDRIDRLHDIQKSRFQAVELNANTNEEQAAEIFVRINYKGTVLNRVDFILTLMSVYWDKGRKQLEQFCRECTFDSRLGKSPKNKLIDPTPDQLLRVAAALAFRRGRLSSVYEMLRGKDLKTGDISQERREAQFEELRRAQNHVIDLNNWHSFLGCIVYSGFRTRRMITSKNALMFSYLFWLIGRFDFGIDKASLKKTIARWFFMAHTTSRYTGAGETQLESDLGLLNAIEPGDGSAFRSELGRIVRSNLGPDFWDRSVPNLLDNTATKSPILCAYWAALNRLNARVLFGEIHVRDVFDFSQDDTSLSRRRLFSRQYLKSMGLAQKGQYDAVANLAFAEGPKPQDKDIGTPSDYWPALTSRLDSDSLSELSYWHALPDGWEHYDYRDFLKARRKRMAKVIRSGYDMLWEEKNASRLPLNLDDLLAVGESDKLEYKSTATYNLHTRQRDPKMEHAIVKTVCGFLNTSGGTLLIGVDDNGEVLGLTKDYRVLREGKDAYERFLRQILDARLSMQTVGVVEIKFEEKNGADVCLVKVAAAGRAIFAAQARGGRDPVEFWVRVGNATKQLHGDDMAQYMADRWD